MSSHKEIPSTVWLCPVHFERFYVPHGGVCPEPGCDERLTEFRRVGDLYARQAYRDALEARTSLTHEPPEDAATQGVSQ